MGAPKVQNTLQQGLASHDQWPHAHAVGWTALIQALKSSVQLQIHYSYDVL